MAIEINSKCLETLRERLADALQYVEVEHNNFLSYESVACLRDLDDVLPSHGSVKEQLHEYFDENPFSSFVIGEISRDIYENSDFQIQINKSPLSTIDRYSNLTLVSKDLVSRFTTLPYEYRFTLPINQELAKYFHENLYPISSGMRLIIPNEGFSASNPLNSDLVKRQRQIHDESWRAGLLSGDLYALREWNQNTLFFQVDIEGYYGFLADSKTEYQAFSKLKSFLGLLIARRGITSNHTRVANISQKGYVHINNQDKWELLARIDVNDDISSFLTSLAVDELDGILPTIEKKAERLVNVCKEIGTSLANDEVTQRIIRSAIWFFDSHYGRNELLRFIQAMIAMEIVLGEKKSTDIIGIQELLRNRCAYLIGNSHQQREEVLREFAEIYNVRSKIVHEGKDQINKKEAKLFGSLQWMVSRVLQEELKLTGKDF